MVQDWVQRPPCSQRLGEHLRKKEEVGKVFVKVLQFVFYISPTLPSLDGRNFVFFSFCSQIKEGIHIFFVYWEAADVKNPFTLAAPTCWEQLCELWLPKTFQTRQKQLRGVNFYCESHKAAEAFFMFQLSYLSDTGSKCAQCAARPSAWTCTENPRTHFSWSGHLNSCLLKQATCFVGFKVMKWMKNVFNC